MCGIYLDLNSNKLLKIIRRKSTNITDMIFDYIKDSLLIIFANHMWLWFLKDALSFTAWYLC